MTKLTAPLKWHGGKHDLASWIISLMPPRCKNPNKPDPDDAGWLHYVEPYFGGGAVLFANDPEGISEVANDLNVELTTFWGVLQEPCWRELWERMQFTPFSEWEFGVAKIDVPRDRIMRAWEFFVRCRQSLSGRMKGFASITRNRTRRGMNEQVSAWLNCIDGLPEVHARLKRVLILNRDALDVIRTQDGPRTLVYADPPYLHTTRVTTGEYQHEMTEEQHRELLETLRGIDGRFLLSGYHSTLYDDFAAKHGWKCAEQKINNHASSQKVKPVKTECVWMNY